MDRSGARRLPVAKHTQPQILTVVRELLLNRAKHGNKIGWSPMNSLPENLPTQQNCG
jgi:hypothetical protein